MSQLYDVIGRGYRELRRPDPRIHSALSAGLRTATSVVNVGAGAGSYEPAGPFVVAVEPAQTMLAQRTQASAPAVQACSTALPFGDATFDTALAILTVHHWPDRAAGLREMSRVARRKVVLVTWDPAFPGFWLTDYFPEILAIDREIFPSMPQLREVLGQGKEVVIESLPIPFDCSDGFLGAYWRRPDAYLDEEVRGAISTFSKLRELEAGLESLRGDLASGKWEARYGDVLSRRELDLGYRLVIASKGA